MDTLLPYLTAEEALQEGLKFDKERGWVEEAWRMDIPQKDERNG